MAMCVMLPVWCVSAWGYDTLLRPQLLYEVSVPDNLIRLSRREQEQGTALMQVSTYPDPGQPDPSQPP